MEIYRFTFNCCKIWFSEYNSHSDNSIKKEEGEAEDDDQHQEHFRDHPNNPNKIAVAPPDVSKMTCVARESSHIQLCTVHYTILYQLQAPV